MHVDLYNLVLSAVVVIVSLTIHELAHARTALAFGDPTAKNMGRVTLNPLAHLELWGTVALFLSAMAGTGIGWAKPVPVNPANLQPRRLGNALVSLAGPMSNVLLALLAAGLIRLMIHSGVWFDSNDLPQVKESLAKPLAILSDLLFSLMMVNFSLAMFNLIPLFPLDGHHIQCELLPVHRQADYMMWQRHYGQFILLGIIFLPTMLRNGLKMHTSLSPLYYATKHVIMPIASHLTGLDIGFRDGM